MNTDLCRIKTNQTATFKQAIEIFQKYVQTVRMVFISNDNNTGGIHIAELKTDNTVLVELNLYAENFEQFECVGLTESNSTSENAEWVAPVISVGIELDKLHKMLKLVRDSDPLTLYIADNKLHIQSENIKEEINLQIPLLELSGPKISSPQVEFQNAFNMNIKEFHAICSTFRESNCDYVEILSTDNKLTFTGFNKDDSYKISKTYKGCNTGESDKIIKGTYELCQLV